MLRWQGNAKNVKKAFQHMFEKMGGFQVRAFALQASGWWPSIRWKRQLSSEPHRRSNRGWLRYTLRHMAHALIMQIPSWNRSQSNSFLKRVLSKTGQEGPSRKPSEILFMSLPVHGFPLTLVDVDPAVLFILEKLPYFTDKALGMHGIPNVGKTPLGRIITMAMSR